MEIPSSESEVEIVSVKIVHNTPKGLTPSQEMLKMKENEVIGHLYRVQDEHAARDANLKRVRDQIAAESPNSRKIRRAAFQRAVYGL